MNHTILLQIICTYYAKSRIFNVQKLTKLNVASYESFAIILYIIVLVCLRSATYFTVNIIYLRTLRYLHAEDSRHECEDVLSLQYARSLHYCWKGGAVAPNARNEGTSWQKSGSPLLARQTSFEGSGGTSLPQITSCIWCAIRQCLQIRHRSEFETNL